MGSASRQSLRAASDVMITRITETIAYWIAKTIMVSYLIIVVGGQLIILDLVSLVFDP